MRDYKSAVGDVLGALIASATTAGAGDVGSLVYALREATEALDKAREAMLVVVALHCYSCDRDWRLTCTVKREREGLPSDCPACHNAPMTASEIARRGYSGHTTKATYLDGSPFPVPETQSVWMKCDIRERKHRGSVTPARSFPTWILRVNGFPVEAVTLETDAHAKDTLEEYWGRELVVGEWSDVEGALPTTTIHDAEAIAEAPPAGVKYRRAALTVDATRAPRW